MTKKYEQVIEQESGIAFSLKRGSCLKVIDIEGKQVADLVAFNAQDRSEALSTGVTIDNNESFNIKVGQYLFSNKYNKMLKIIEDSVGVHDLIHPACRLEMYQYQYKIKEYHPNCYDNLKQSLNNFLESIDYLPNPFNIFMNTVIHENGNIQVKEPLSKQGDYILLKAEMDLIVAISACSVKESKCNAFKCSSIKIEIIDCEEC